MGILGGGSIQTSNVLTTSKSMKRHVILLYIQYGQNCNVAPNVYARRDNLTNRFRRF